MKRLNLFVHYLIAAVADTLRGFCLNSKSLYRIVDSFGQRMGFLLYAAHTGVASHTDAIYAISATLPDTYDQAGYESTDLVFTAIGKVASFLAYGATRPIREWVPIQGSVEYMKGSPRYGQGDLVMGDVPADAGQVILKAADASANHYSLKITYPDGEVHYLDVIVASWVLSGGAEGVPMERTATLGICRAPVIVAAA